MNEYARVELKQVYQIAHNEIEDLQGVVQLVLKIWYRLKCFNFIKFNLLSCLQVWLWLQTYL